MKNIIILIFAVISILLWVSDFLFEDKLTADKQIDEPLPVITKDISATQFNVEGLADILGINFARIKDKQQDALPDVFDISISLISIHTSGGFAKARLRITGENNKETVVDAVKGDKFHSLELKSIMSTGVELINNEKEYLLKMYKPQVINITRTENVEEVSNEK
ncbi:hypothetical protein [Pseudoalteromonas sp. MB47]|uniref:hypothetical protein n=1 Tax=Pseudoalteromonas sp. MB47 TaxID=2588452 RepID=UPI0014076289|nr:hypothetical protein [Pseudoalteromonas sp. MB47]NHH89260.1 hypothetical protein [Pseudoalteromonas sp. MB47]